MPRAIEQIRWAVLIEEQDLDFSQHNSLNCHSKAWLLSQGKPLIYDQIDHLIKCGFKNFIIALFHIDQVVKNQIAQLKTLYQDCVFKCLKVKDSWLFEKHQVLTKQAEKYLFHYINVFLKEDQHLSTASSIWIQKIETPYLNPLEQMDAMQPLLWIKQANLKNGTDKVGLWINIKNLTQHYKQLNENKHDFSSETTQPRILKDLFNSCQEVLLNLDLIKNQVSSQCEDRLVATRFFNQVSIDSETGVIVKRSTELKKLRQEVSFYQQLPESLKIYFPRLLGSGQLADTTPPCDWYSLEFYPYKSLSQYFVYYALPIENWEMVFKRLLGMHQQFMQFQPNTQSKLDRQALYQFYSQKLSTRIDAALENPILERLIHLPSVQLNGKKLKGFCQLQSWLQQRLMSLSDNVTAGFVHGDLCFSNILYEPSSSVIRLIDPRGEFMGSVNWGDPRYDLAKIMHSVHGRYDFIIHDLFTLTCEKDEFCFQTPQSDYLDEIYQSLIRQIEQQTQYQLNDLILLESLLFLTMLPLHNDKVQRQIAFFLIGLKLLNQVYQDENKTIPVSEIKSVLGLKDETAKLTELTP